MLRERVAKMGSRGRGCAVGQVVKKGGRPVAPKCRDSIGSFGAARRSVDYSLGTGGTIREWADQGHAEPLHGRAHAVAVALTFPRHNPANCQLSTAPEPVIKSGISGRAWAPLLRFDCRGKVGGR